MPYVRKRISDNQAGFPGIPNSIGGQFGSFVPSLGSLGDSLGSNFGSVLSGDSIKNALGGGNIGNLISGGGNIGSLINGGGNIASLITGGGNIKDLISGGANIGNLFGGGGKPPFGLPSDIKGTYHYLNQILRSGQEGTSPYHPATTVFNQTCVLSHHVILIENN